MNRPNCISDYMVKNGLSKGGGSDIVMSDIMVIFRE